MGSCVSAADIGGATNQSTNFISCILGEEESAIQHAIAAADRDRTPSTEYDGETRDMDQVDDTTASEHGAKSNADAPSPPASPTAL